MGSLGTMRRAGTWPAPAAASPPSPPLTPLCLRLGNTGTTWATATFASSFSLEIWVQLPTLSTFLTSPSTFNYPRLYEMGNYVSGTSATGIISLLLYYSSGSLYLLMGATTSSGSFSYASSPLPQYAHSCQVNFTSYLTSWTHIVAVNDAANSKMVLYLNGAQVSTDSQCASAAIGSVARAQLGGTCSVYAYGVGAPSTAGFDANTQGGYLSELVRFLPPVLAFWPFDSPLTGAGSAFAFLSSRPLLSVFSVWLAGRLRQRPGRVDRGEALLCWCVGPVSKAS